MDAKRAEEIMQSYGVINVNYGGKPVWIESTRGDEAQVTLIGTDKMLDVPIRDLVESPPRQENSLRS